MADEKVKTDPSTPAEQPKPEVVNKADFELVTKKAQELEAKLSEYAKKEAEKEKADLEQQGNLKGLVEKLRGEVKAKEDAIKLEKAKISSSMLYSQLTMLAKDEGCQQPSDLIKLIPQEELKTIQIGDDYKANLDDLKRVVGKMKADKSYLFQKDLKIVDGKPSSQAVSKGKPTDINVLRERVKLGLAQGILNSKTVKQKTQE
jgi:hypothetical protein